MRITGTLLVLLSCFALQGCLAVVAVAAAGVGYDQHEKNEVSMDMPADLPETWEATLQTLRNMGYPVYLGLRCGAMEGEIDLDEPKLRVKVEKQAENLTKVRVRIGTFQSQDHKRRSNLILEGIRRRVD